MSVPIRSHGLLLREWRLEAGDIETVALARADPAGTGLSSTSLLHSPDARAAAERWICEGYELESQDLGVRLAMCSVDGGQTLGGLELSALGLDQFLVSFWLLADHRGGGLESRTLAATVDWLAGERPRGRLWADIDRGDHAALAALRLCGFAQAPPERAPRGLGATSGCLFHRDLRPTS